jgi:hypothetical protein
VSLAPDFDSWITRLPDDRSYGDEPEEQDAPCGGCGEVVPERYLDRASPEIAALYCTACRGTCGRCGRLVGQHSAAEWDDCCNAEEAFEVQALHERGIVGGAP